MIDGGMPVYRHDDNSTLGGTFSYFNHDVSGAEVTDGATTGWTLQTTLRVLDGGSPGGSPFIRYADGSKGWQLQFGTDGNGDTRVYSVDDGSGTSITLTGLAARISTSR